MSSSTQFRSDLKIIVIGTSGTGKTNFVNKWTKNIFSDTYKATIVSEFGFKIFENDGKLYRIQLWDLAGQDKNAMVTKIFAKDAHGAVIMSDATNIQTREDTLRWKSAVDEATSFLDGGKLPCIIVENKYDLTENYDKIDNSEIDNFAKDHEFVGGFLTSSKTGLNIGESMEYLIKNIIKRMEDMASKGNDVFMTERKSVALDPEKHNQCLAAKKKHSDEIDEIQYDDLGDNKLEIYVYKTEEEEENKYSCEINLNKLKKKYDILNSITDVDTFIALLNELKEVDRLKENLYLEKDVVQVGILLTNIIGKAEEITFELVPENAKRKDLIKHLIKELIKIKGNKKDLENKKEEEDKKSDKNNDKNNENKNEKEENKN